MHLLMNKFKMYNSTILKQIYQHKLPVPYVTKNLKKLIGNNLPIQ